MVRIVFKDGQLQEFYFTTKISDNIEELENGFLRCYNVVMGRTGIQYYGDTAIDRQEEDVFHPDTLRSIEGKTVTLTHPEDFVDVENVKDYEIGYILNARRDGDNIVGDIMITDKRAIDLILSKEMRELSLGYQSKVVDNGEGGWKQTNIIVNHLALVNKGRAGNAMIVDHADEHTNITRKEYGLVEKESLTLGQKILRLLGVKSATFNDDSVVELTDAEEEKKDTEKETEDEENKEKESKESKDSEKESDENENTKDSEKEEKETKDGLEANKTEDSKEEKVQDDYSSKRTTITKEEFEGEYGKTQRVVKTEEQEVHKDKDENENEEGEINMKITLDSALARMKELQALKGTEAYELSMKALDAECVEAGIGSILPKETPKKEDSIFNDVDPTKNIKDEQNKQEMLPKFTGKAFNDAIKGIYNEFSPRNLNKLANGSVLERAQLIKEKSEYEISDFIR